MASLHGTIYRPDRVGSQILGSLRNDDADGNDDATKQ